MLPTVWHPTRTLLVGAGCAVLVSSLTACSPVPEAWLAVTVEDGAVVVLVRTCDTEVVAVEVERTGDGPSTTIDEEVVEIGPDSSERVATGVPLDALGEGVGHSVDGRTDDDFEVVDGVRFTRADIATLGPGEVPADGRFAPDDEDDPTYVENHRMPEADFVDQAC
jgi:hypothetical protein